MEGQSNIHYRDAEEAGGRYCAPSLAAPSGGTGEPILQHIDGYLSSRLTMPVRLSDLCGVTGLQPRQLQRFFRAHVSQTPMQYVRAARLRHARRLLRQAGCPCVTWAATQSGFWHMAQFSQDYRRMFGESPSETLRACRR